MNLMHDIGKYGFVAGSMWFAAKTVSAVAIVYGGLSLATDSVADKYGLNKPKIINKEEAVAQYNGVKSVEPNKQISKLDQIDNNNVSHRNVAGEKVSVDPKQKEDMIVVLREDSSDNVYHNYYFSKNFYNNTISHWNLERHSAKDYLYQYRPDKIYFMDSRGNKERIPLRYYDELIQEERDKALVHSNAKLDIKENAVIRGAHIEAKKQDIRKQEKRKNKFLDKAYKKGGDRLLDHLF
ncbi:MAG: hypothetical protein OIF36_03680 [Alphaproteobacteria bacterium]|jgi:hypothetical protein|nr:hypothetical protein [Alphaproteobacteria bacterium]MCV6599561.1 hypothetical protein [Alphaproteobacteria bacterium]